MSMLEIKDISSSQETVENNKLKNLTFAVTNINS